MCQLGTLWVESLFRSFAHRHSSAFLTAFGTLTGKSSMLVSDIVLPRIERARPSYGVVNNKGIDVAPRSLI